MPDDECPWLLSHQYFAKFVLALCATWLRQSRFSKLPWRLGMWIPNPHTRLTFYEGSMTLWAIHQRLWSWNGYLAQTPETLMYWAFKLLGLRFLGNAVPFLLVLMSLWHWNLLGGGVSNVQHQCADAVERVCERLERRSPYYDVMESLGICIFTQLDDYVCQGVFSQEIGSSSSLNTV